MTTEDYEVVTLCYHEDIQAGDEVAHIVTIFDERWDKKHGMVPANQHQITVRRPIRFGAAK
jgi:hypothetical protein